MPQYCRLCILPDTRPGVRLDASGVCGGCRNAEAKRTLDWNARARTFAELATEARECGRTWDCVIPVSGGKDSYWQVVTCLEHGLRPLCVTYAYPGRNQLGERNLRSLLELGVDHLELRLNPNVERSFVRKAFLQTGISGLVNHMAIYSIPLRVAVAHDIPLVVYGENSAFEYGSEEDGLAGARLSRRWLMRFGVTAGTIASDWIDDDLSARDLSLLQRPTDEQLESAGVAVVFLGHYFPWDPETSKSIALKHGFEACAEGPKVGHYDFANIDDDMIGVHHHPKWHKFGITRAWDTLSMEIRAGRMKRADALDWLRARGDDVPTASIERFCEHVELTHDEYFATLERFRNPDIWVQNDGRWEIEGFLIPDFPWSERVGRAST